MASVVRYRWKLDLQNQKTFVLPPFSVSNDICVWIVFRCQGLGLLETVNKGPRLVEIAKRPCDAVKGRRVERPQEYLQSGERKPLLNELWPSGLSV